MCLQFFFSSGVWVFFSIPLIIKARIKNQNYLTLLSGNKKKRDPNSCFAFYKLEKNLWPNYVHRMYLQNRFVFSCSAYTDLLLFSSHNATVRSRCCEQSAGILHEAHNNDRMARDEEQKNKKNERKNLIMQIIFPISLFHMNRSLFHNPVKRASHRSLCRCAYANIQTNKFSSRRRHRRHRLTLFFSVSILVCRDIAHTVLFRENRVVFSWYFFYYILFNSLFVDSLLYTSSSLPNRLSA